MKPPISNVKNHTERSGETGEIPLVTYYTVESDSPVVKCRTNLKDTVRDHRVRVLFPSGIDNGTVALTLFRSVGWIAKGISTRIGDAGPEIYTPDAQYLREMTFEYAVCPHEGNAYSGISSLADEFNNELLNAPGRVCHNPPGALLFTRTG